jgi:SEC-C motif-containing protein
MRSRFAAFATKNVDYLWRTLHPDHEDRARPREQVLAELRDACATHRYLALRVLDARDESAAHPARVLFAVRVFHKGRELSFFECSDFVREGRDWRYLTGRGASCSFDAVPVTTIDDAEARFSS